MVTINGYTSDTRNFENEIANLLHDKLGLSAYQLLRSLELKLNERKIALASLTKTITDKYYQFYETDNISKSCNIVKPKGFCIAKREKLNLAKVPTAQIIKLIQKNSKKYEFIKSQYIGTEQGVVMISGPRIVWPRNNDHRYQSWYAQASNPIKKDIVLIFDNSEKTSNTVQGREIQSYFVEAVDTLINTLNDQDRLSLVAMSTSHFSPFTDDKTCQGNKFMFVTPNNKKHLKKFIHQLNAQGIANYIDAFNTTFSIFSSSSMDKALNVGTREKLIIFLTYSTPNSDITTVKQFIEKSINSPIFTYAVGDNINNETLTFLQEISTKTYKYNGNFEQQGMFKFVRDVDKIKFELATFYKSLKDSNKNRNVLVTSPFYNGIDGLLISFCMPIWIYGFLGVARIDVSFTDIFSDIEFFLGAQSSYTFLTDSMNRALLHPLISPPSHTFQTLTYLPFNFLEPQLSPLQIDQMISSTEGSFAAVTQRINSLGISIYDGIDVQNVSSKYYWVKTKEFRFMICFVVAENDYLTNNQFRLSYHQLAYHKISSGCPYKAKIISRNITTIKFGPELFLQPYQYLSSMESYSILTSYENYLKGKSKNSIFKNQIWSEMAMTHQLDRIWSQLDNKYSTPYGFRFYGSKLGVFKSFPGYELAEQFTPTHQSWYKRTMFHKGKIAISPIERNNIQTDWINTVSHVVYEGRQNGKHDSQDNVLGIMGLEIRVGYFYYTMEKFIPKCQLSLYSCIMIDVSGLVISYKQAAQNPNDTHSYMHIISIEPKLSSELISKNILQRRQCFNTLKLKNQLFWKVIFDGEMYSGRFFTIQKIRNSNAILIIINRNDELLFENYCLKCKPEMASCQENIECQCPCFMPNEFYDCQLGQREKTPICSVALIKQFPVHSKAYFAQCGRKPSCYGNEEKTCSKLKHCAWCYTKWNIRYIHRRTECVIPIKCVKFIEKPKGSSKSIAPSLGGSLGIMGGFVVLILLISLYWKLHKNKSCRKTIANEEPVRSEMTNIESIAEVATDESAEEEEEDSLDGSFENLAEECTQYSPDKCEENATEKYREDSNVESEQYATNEYEEDATDEEGSNEESARYPTDDSTQYGLDESAEHNIDVSVEENVADETPEYATYQSARYAADESEENSTYEFSQESIDESAEEPNTKSSENFAELPTYEEAVDGFLQRDFYNEKERIVMFASMKQLELLAKSKEIKRMTDEQVIPDDFLIKDIIKADAGYIIFGDNHQIDLLKQAKILFMDGTFKVISEPFQ
ncbi:DgyrCDS14779 [Dimorphilus gyrociliatus]|uniref:DgyrCDS14779 n=1 Tax=Dimorphilus gyrociliatus TaxID=2664684 RepID=A0A7I8WES4_9ANNE|nr:DgyrCDS14779 [Dimorphilus gyrociliatus]